MARIQIHKVTSTTSEKQAKEMFTMFTAKECPHRWQFNGTY